MIPLRIGGMTPLSTTDYPGALSAVVFCQGCPWRCGYCHNSHLISATAEGCIAWQEVLQFLETRRGLLDAVVFSGGEPTLQPGLALAMDAVRNRGFKVGLHTAGMYPRRLSRLLPLVDWVGLDIKTSFSDYERITGVAGSGEGPMSSLKAILESGVAYECRTTVDARVLDERGVERIAHRLADLGVRHYALQECRYPRGTHGARAAELDWFEEAGDRIAPGFDTFSLRRAG